MKTERRAKKGKKGKKGKDKGKKGKKGKGEDGGKKKGKKGDKKEKKEKKGKKGKKNKNNNNNRECDGNNDLLDDSIESVRNIFNAAEEEAQKFNASSSGVRSRDAPATSASRPAHARSMQTTTTSWVGNYDPIDDMDPLSFSRGPSFAMDASTPVHRPESRCSMRSPVDTVVLPIPRDREDDYDERTMYNMPRRNGPRW